MVKSQQFVPIESIKNDLVFCKDGTISLVLSTSAVNFGLLFENEQLSIIQGFAGFLNSLTFPIQISIRSTRLDVSQYLTTLDKAMKFQDNPLLKQLTAYYRQFVESLIKENNVLDKQFYLCLYITPLELGVINKTSADLTKKALTVLSPRRDHIIKQLARIGIKAKQLATKELIKLYFDIYNPPLTATPAVSATTPTQSPAPTADPANPPTVNQTRRPSYSTPEPPKIQIQRPAPAVPFPMQRLANPNIIRQPKPAALVPPPSLSAIHLAPPFIVEELT